MPVKAAKRLTGKGVHLLHARAVAAAQEMGVAATIAICDTGGHLLMLERMEGGRFHTVFSATTKSATAASNRRPTSAIGAQGQALDTLHALGLALAAGPSNWTAMEGGYPILIEGECVGGIGVSGGSWEQDAAIARAALEAVGARVDHF